MAFSFCSAQRNDNTAERRDAPLADGVIPFTWDIERLSIRAAGQIMPMKDNKQEWRWQFTVDKDITADLRASGAPSSSYNGANTAHPHPFRVNLMAHSKAGLFLAVASVARTTMAEPD